MESTLPYIMYMNILLFWTVGMRYHDFEIINFFDRSTRDQLDMANTEVRELKRSNKDIEQQLIWKVPIVPS